jgi:uncharacterized membrane protein YfcA
MNIWMVIAVVGGIVFLGGIYFEVLQYRRGRLDRREFVLLMIVSCIVVLIALADVLFTDSFSGWASFLFVLWLCMTVLLQSRRRRRQKRDSGRINGRSVET